MSDDALKRLADAVRTARQKRRMTQDQLAEALELSTDAISMLERGKLAPSFKTLCALGSALGLDLGPTLTPETAAMAVELAAIGAEVATILDGASDRDRRLALELAKTIRQVK